MAETTLAQKSLPILDPQYALMWHHLIREQNGEWGAAEEILVQRTNMKRSDLIKVLISLMELGLVSHRLQKVGTGGDCDHYYRLIGKGHQLVVNYTPPEAPSSGDNK